MATRRVCVVGAGVVGLSSAVCVLEQCPGVEVTILADKFSPHTTSDVSAGIWQPYCLGDTSPELIKVWSIATWDHLFRLYSSEDAGRVGCQLLSGFSVADTERPDFDFKDEVLGYRPLTAKELDLFPPARWGVFFTTLQTDISVYLPWLMTRFKAQGGKIQQRRIASLDEVTDQFDVVVNCTGLGSHSLLGDNALKSVRGQVFRFLAPWVKHFYTKMYPGDRPTYIIPGIIFEICVLWKQAVHDGTSFRPHNVVVGGVSQEGDWNPDVDEADAKDIYTRAVSLLPSLKDAKIESNTAGLRPARTEVRLELQILKKQGKSTPVVHNYGHGGAGVSLHWGCAQHATRLVREALTTSKL